MIRSAYISSSHAPVFLARNPSHICNGTATKTPAAASGDSIVFPTKSTQPKALICRPTGKLCNSSKPHSSTRRKHSHALLVEEAAESLVTDLINKEKPKQDLRGSGIRTTSMIEKLHLDSEVVNRPTDRVIGPVEIGRFESPSVSPKESLGQEKWRQYHGSENWVGLLGNELHPNLRREIVKYGEFAQATYDALDFEARSKHCGSCRYSRHKMFDKVGLHNTGYKITKYLYAMSDIHLPKWFGRSDSMDKDAWSKDSNWMGYVAVSTDEEVKRLGRRDIVVVWRGTVTQLEWLENLKDILHPVGEVGSHENSSVKVERGFLSIYTSKNCNTRYNKLSASEQAMNELRHLVEVYTQRGEDVSITMTGHSLGGALALLSAYEVAAKGLNSHKAHPERNIPVTVFSFAGPRVGNDAFKDRLEALGVKVLRVVSKQDMVPKMPGIIFNEGMEKFEELMGPLLDRLPWTYTHVGVELKLDYCRSPFLKQKPDPVECHNLEGYLHLLDGFQSSSAPFRRNAKRDVALVNKASDMLRPELMVPRNWYQVQNKGLVRNFYGRWVQTERDPEDIPSPNNVEQESLGFEI